MRHVDVPERTSSLAGSAAPSTNLTRESLAISIKSLSSSMRSLKIFDAAYWDTRRELLMSEIQLGEIRMEEKEELHLKKGGSLTDSAWIHRRESFEAERQSMNEEVRAALKVPAILLQDARNRAGYSRPSNLLAEKAFIEPPVRCFQGNRARDGTVQSNFGKNLVAAYNSKHPDNNSIWCPVLHTFEDNQDNRVAAHIFPRRLGRRLMNQIFGIEADEDLYGVRNGMIIAPTIEAKFDRFQVVIVPAKPRTEANPVDDWVLRIVDHQIDDYKVHEIGKTFKELDGRPLVFRSNARPAARYLYFHYVVSMLLAKSNRSRKTGVMGIASKDIVWATPGKYIRQNMLAALIRGFGDVDPTAREAYEEYAICETDASSSEDVSRLSREVVSVCLDVREEQELVGGSLVGTEEEDY